MANQTGNDANTPRGSGALLGTRALIPLALGATLIPLALVGTLIPLALSVGVASRGELPTAQAAPNPPYQVAVAGNPGAGINPCNPYAGANPFNPCAAKKPLNPCAAANPCNPCAAARQ